VQGRGGVGEEMQALRLCVVATLRRCGLACVKDCSRRRRSQYDGEQLQRLADSADDLDELSVLASTLMSHRPLQPLPLQQEQNRSSMPRQSTRGHSGPLQFRKKQSPPGPQAPDSRGGTEVSVIDSCCIGKYILQPGAYTRPLLSST